MATIKNLRCSFRSSFDALCTDEPRGEKRHRSNDDRVPMNDIPTSSVQRAKARFLDHNNFNRETIPK